MRLSGLSDVLRNIDREMARQPQAVQTACEVVERLIENEARTRHPWTTRNSHLANSIFAGTEATGDKTSIILSAGMPYAVFLELGMERGWRKYKQDYQWLRLAVNKMIPVLRRALKHHLGGGS